MKPLDHYWNGVNFVSILLLPLSIVFFCLSQIRKQLYKLKLLSSYKAPLPVIVVGNITVGGTGKTPFIIELIKQLQLQGKKPGVISRGYGGQSQYWPLVVNDQTDAVMVGDEPQLIFQHTKCPIVVGPNRKNDIELLLEKFKCDVILSDDGLQHYALQRDIEICIVDAIKLYGNGWFLPAGPMRESLARLKQVDMVLFNGGDDTVLSFKMTPTMCVPVAQNELRSIELKKFSGKTVHAVAGIGHPQRFFSMLEQYNIKVIPHAYTDHHHYRLSDLIFDDDFSVLMTEKDAVKCGALTLNNHWSVPVAIALSESAQHKVNQIIDSIFT